MKNTIVLSLLLMMFTLTSCELAGDLFGAGFYTGIFIVILVVAIIIFIVAKLNRRR
ncbi:MAG: hypothetical protein ABIR06_09605 [Cyclobacteriaceae bacterium]